MNKPIVYEMQPSTRPGLLDGFPCSLPNPLPAVPAFDAKLLPESLREWCEDAADSLQVPLDFTGVPAVIGLAGTLSRTIGIRMKRHQQWVERPIFWGCVVGRPSSGKSPALSPTRRMLERLEELERVAYENALQDHKADAMIATAMKANARQAIQTALKQGNKLKAQQAAEAALLNEDPPSQPRIIVNDTTVEKLGELLRVNPRGLLLYRDELVGLLARFDQEGHEGDRAFFLECWNGTGVYTFDRIGRGTIRIPACAISILGGMQPGKLDEYVRAAVRGGHSDDGLIQRFQLAVYPDISLSWKYTDRRLDPRAEEVAWTTYQRLRSLVPELVGAQREEWCDVPFLRFDDEAQDRLIEWMTSHMSALRADVESPWLESHFAKYPALVGRLALVLHLADGGQHDIGAETLSKALEWTEYLKGHARRMYAPIIGAGLIGAHTILKRRNDLGDTFTGRDLQRRGWAGLGDRETVADAIEILVEHRHLSERVDSTGGRPSKIYTWTTSP